MQTTDDNRGLMCRMDNAEKRELSILARRAWEFMARKGATDETADEFRHRISLQACGRRISEALRGDYNDIERDFLLILGETKKAIRAVDRSQTAARRIALAKLTALLASQGRDISYAAPLIRNFSRGSATIDTASPKQLWAVFYELGGSGNKRGTQRRKNWKQRTTATAHPF